MPQRSVLNFRTQAEQILAIMEDRLQTGHRQQALEFLILKFKTLYDQGVASGRLYEREGVYPYASIDENKQ